MARQIKNSVLIFIFALCFLLSGCMFDTYKTTTLENGEECKYSVYEEDWSAYFGGVDLTSASHDEIMKLKSDDVRIPSAVGKINSEEEAAKHAAEILNDTYENWTFDNNQLLVGYNEIADIYFAHGQAKDREHCSDLLGCIVFDAKTGEILLLNRKPVSDSPLYWVPEKSHFVDYEIDGDRIKFRYSIHFVNSFNDDMQVSLSAKFNSKELKGWLKNESFFKGCDQNGEMLCAIVKADSSADVIFTFEGEYLGGEVNENLSFPEELIITSY